MRALCGFYPVTRTQVGLDERRGASLQQNARHSIYDDACRVAKHGLEFSGHSLMPQMENRRRLQLPFAFRHVRPAIMRRRVPTASMMISGKTARDESY